MAGGASGGRSEPGGTRFDSPLARIGLARIVVLPQKLGEKRCFGGRFGVGLGSVWGRFGVVLGSIWDRVGIVLGLFWDCFGIHLGSILLNCIKGLV